MRLATLAIAPLFSKPGTNSSLMAHQLPSPPQCGVKPATPPRVSLRGTAVDVVSVPCQQWRAPGSREPHTPRVHLCKL